MEKLKIALEGIDGCGKSTILPWLAEEVRAITGSGVVTAHALGKDGVGLFGNIPKSLSSHLYSYCRKDIEFDHIKQLLGLAFGGGFSQSESNILLGAARRNTYSNIFSHAINAGCSYVMDRSVFSSYAYSLSMSQTEFSVQLNSERLDIGRCYLPSIVILLDVNPITAIERRIGRYLEPSDNDLKSVEFFDNVSSRYLTLANTYSDNFIVVDANQSIESVKADIMAGLINFFDLKKLLGD